jgi:uncharacterized SAM-binding protein YcdF (DUF218 family)
LTLANRQPPRVAQRRATAGHSPGRASGRAKGRRRQPPWRARLILAAVAVVVGLLAWGAVARWLAPASNTTRTRFDAIIVLGAPADTDGNPTPTQLARVNEALHEYELGVAPRLIITGGATRRGFVEARVMAQAAHALGIPESAIYVEPEALDTIHNACYSVRIMKAHGWRSAEVISEAYHLPRAGIIFSHLPLEWRTHAAPPVQAESGASATAGAGLEILKTTRYLVWARQWERCEP